MYAKIDSIFSTVLWIIAFCAIYYVMPHGSASASNVEKNANAPVAQAADPAAQ